MSEMLGGVIDPANMNDISFGLVTILHGDSRKRLLDIPDESVDVVITSPPYYGLRSYKTDPLVWGGNADCCHKWGPEQRSKRKDILPPSESSSVSRMGTDERQGLGSVSGGRFCVSCGAWKGSLGNEPDPKIYVANLVDVFRIVRQKMRPWATLFLNLADSYAATRTYQVDGTKQTDGSQPNFGPSGPDGLKEMDQVGIPWRVVSALQADGWWWRQTIVWAKGISFCEAYSGTCMPESIDGWRWERHRVKVGYQEPTRKSKQSEHPNKTVAGFNGRYFDGDGPKYKDCPGCPKCSPNDGFIQRRGSWRPTSSHEYIFMLTKSEEYFSDPEAVKEVSSSGPSDIRRMIESKDRIGGLAKKQKDPLMKASGLTNIGRKQVVGDPSGRNLRSVWVINPRPFPGAHFSTFPPDLVEPMIKVSTSERGNCPKCGSPWARIIRRTSNYKRREQAYVPNNQSSKVDSTGWEFPDVKTLGWKRTCGCGHRDPIRPVVLDPFVGSGTTLLKAKEFGRRGIGIELNEQFCKMAADRVKQIEIF